MNLNRRDFLKTSAVATAGAALGIRPARASTPPVAPQSIPGNRFGLTAAQVNSLLASTYEPCGQIDRWRVGDNDNVVLVSEHDDAGEGFIVRTPFGNEALLRVPNREQVRGSVAELLAGGAVPFDHTQKRMIWTD